MTSKNLIVLGLLILSSEVWTEKNCNCNKGNNNGIVYENVNNENGAKDQCKPTLLQSIEQWISLGNRLGVISSMEGQTNLFNCNSSTGNDVKCSTCRNDTIGIKVGNKGYYVEQVYKANFFGAFEKCQTLGMRLATIMSQEEQDALEKYITSLGISDHLWLSGSDLARENTFVWMSTAEPIVYSNFAPGEPNNNHKSEHCVHIVYNDPKKQWNDRPCTYEQFFICEYILCNS